MAANTKFNWLTFWMIVCSSIGGILYGYDVGVFSGTMPFIKATIGLSDSQIGLIGGAVFGGGLIGTLVTGYLSDQFGRRKMIIVAGIIFIVAILLIMLPPDFYRLVCARTLLGIAIGVIAVAVPAYLSEIAPSHMRGKSVTVFQLFLTIGILLAYIVDTLLTPSGSWRSMFAVILIPTAILLITMFYLPESPRWLTAKGLQTKALTILSSTRSQSEAVTEMREIEASLQQKYAGWSDLFSRHLALPLFIVIAVGILNQLTAINAFLLYAPAVFKDAGFVSAATGMQGTIVLGVINLAGTIIAFFLIDLAGRKLLLMIGTAGIVLSYVFLGIMAHGGATPVASLAGLVAFVICYAIGPGAVVWLVLSELLPTEVRGKGLAIGLFGNSLAAWVVTTFFLPIKDHLGMSGAYFIFAGCTVLYFLVALCLVPETKKRSLEQVQKDFAAKVHAPPSEI